MGSSFCIQLMRINVGKSEIPTNHEVGNEKGQHNFPLD
jgi:hypothetical protein